MEMTAIEWAESMAELDDSKTVSEWLDWLREALTGDHEPIREVG